MTRIPPLTPGLASPRFAPLFRGEMLRIENDELPVIDLDSFTDRSPANKASAALVQRLLTLDPAHGLQTALDLLAATPAGSPVDANLARLAAVLAHKLDGTWDRASVFLALAERAAPGVERTSSLKLRYLMDTGQATEALALAAELCEANPGETDYHLARLQLMLDDARPEDAVTVAATLQGLLKNPRLDARKRRKAQGGVARALFKACKPEEAVAVYRDMLRSAPDSLVAHSGIAELVLPNFAAPTRAASDEALRQGGLALVAGDAATAKAKASEALDLDANDGLAHKLLVWATHAERRAVEEQAAGGPKLVGPLATDESRDAIVRQLELILSRAKVGTPARPAVPADLFPAWPDLSPLQQATVAYSVLAFGKLLPRIVESGLVCHLVPPGVTAIKYDSRLALDNRNPFGRYRYAVRGWQDAGTIVIGAEKLADIARGGYNTITHEFAHAVEAVLRRIATAAVVCPEGADPLAGVPKAIDHLYEEAMAREDGQRLLDGYSGNSVHEYLAQGWMAYLSVDTADGENTAARLYGRDPHLFALLRDLTREVADYPPLVPAPDPPAIPEVEAVGAAEMWQLSTSGGTPEVREAATRAFASLSDFYLAAPAVISDATKKREAELLASARAVLASANA